eukprot:gene6166-33957_t
MAAISYTDGLIGGVLDALDATGRAAETLLGEHGEWRKMTNFELGVRPAAMGQRSPALIELVDVFPTAAALAGLGQPEQQPVPLEGQSFAALFDDLKAAPPKRYALSQYARCPRSKGPEWEKNSCPSVPTNAAITVMGYSLRVEGWRYTEWAAFDGSADGGKGRVDWSKPLHGVELYDHRTGDENDFDFHENTNVANRTEHAALVAGLSEQLRALVANTTASHAASPATAGRSASSGSSESASTARSSDDELTRRAAQAAALAAQQRALEARLARFGELLDEAARARADHRPPTCATVIVAARAPADMDDVWASSPAAAPSPDDRRGEQPAGAVELPGVVEAALRARVAELERHAAELEQIQKSKCPTLLEGKNVELEGKLGDHDARADERGRAVRRALRARVRELEGELGRERERTTAASGDGSVGDASGVDRLFGRHDDGSVRDDDTVPKSDAGAERAAALADAAATARAAQEAVEEVREEAAREEERGAAKRRVAAFIEEWTAAAARAQGDARAAAAADAAAEVAALRATCAGEDDARNSARPRKMQPSSCAGELRAA